jgi:PKHD-type hydroxylase
MNVVWRLRATEEIGTYVTVENIFTAEELALIKEQAASFSVQEGTVEEPNANIKIRKSIVRWMVPNNETTWLYKKLVDTIQKVNSEMFNLNLYGMQTFQYTIYENENASFYGPHKDNSRFSRDGLVRKLSFSLQLTEPEEYEGGNLVLDTVFRPFIVPKSLGTIAFFLSDIPHEVTPVTKGERHSLVGWIVGPPKV